jgi:effector-binding domain-containing protein
MRSSRFLNALTGALMAFGLWQSGLPLGQAQAEEKAANPAATAPSAPASPSAAAPKADEPAAASTEAQLDDLIGLEVTMTEQPIVHFSGSASWENAFETILDSFKKVYAFLDKEKIAPAGPPMTIYTSTDDKGFNFRAAVPVAQAPSNLPDGLAADKSPAGKALKYVHRGTYDSLDSTYEVITNQLDEKGLEAQELFVETYLTDPRTTPDDNLVIEVYVPIK